MPSGAEAIRAQRQARQASQASQAPDTPAAPVSAGAPLVGALPVGAPPVGTPGRAVIVSTWAGTVVFLVATAVAAFVPTARIPAVVVDLALLLGGSGLYFWGWAVAAGRSRDDEITLWNLILLEDVAPPKVRAQLLGALAVQVVVAAATCWITAALAFGWLVPVWGLAHCEYWGASYGTFPPRVRASARDGDGMRRRGRG
jgi:hypothetical protein